MAPANDPPGTTNYNTSGGIKTKTSVDEVDSTILKPGSVKINVKGAFIVDPDLATPGRTSPPIGGGGGTVASGTHETKDIRLPNQKAVVSHVAIDVCPIFSLEILHHPCLL